MKAYYVCFPTISIISALLNLVNSNSRIATPSPFRKTREPASACVPRHLIDKALKIEILWIDFVYSDSRINK